MTTRTVTVKDGIRVVTLEFGDGESWYNYIIVPRSKVLESIKQQRKDKYTPNPMVGFSNGQYFDYVSGEHYGGPGQSFIRRPYIRAKNRRFYVFCQSGGLDI